MNTFAARLALVRQAKGWNLKEAALACELPASSWRSWEIEGRMPHNYIDVCQSIAASTGVNYRWLIDGTTPPGGGPGDDGVPLPRLDSNQQPADYRSDALPLVSAA